MARTDSERYLAKLCRRSFLRLWSWPSLYRDQGASGSTGKEVCDLLVIFDRHILIFSDKYCAFPDSGDHALDWCRWFKRAVAKSADQVWGAERWLRQFPERIYVDEACTKRLPITLPPPSDWIVHRVVVAHGAGERCRALLGGTGSLMIRPSMVGPDHYDRNRSEFAPFAVGRLDADRGFVHVVDDFSLDVVLDTLDTTADFAAYLQKKEALIDSGRLIGAAGEEELLAFYLSKMNQAGEHDFVVPSQYDGFSVDEGFWAGHIKHPDRIAQLKADQVSYAWDRLVEKFTFHAVTGTQYTASHPDLVDQELSLRFLARENRTRRRMLAKALVGIMTHGDSHDQATRVVLPSGPDDPHFVFLSVKLIPDHSYGEYRQYRRKLLEAYCMVAKLRWPEAHHVVGIATEPASFAGERSEDLILLDGTHWDAEAQADAQRLADDLGLLTNTRRWEHVESEYPRAGDREMAKGRNRNQACSCGSGKKVKHCCGR